MSSKFELLKSHKNFFILIIDEIQIKAAINTYLSYGTHGFDHQDPQFTVKSVFRFMIKSLYGTYKEIISLIPSYRNTYKTLFDWAKDNLKLINGLGNTTVSIVTNNKPVNVKIFAQFNLQAGVSKGHKCYHNQ